MPTALALQLRPQVETRADAEDLILFARHAALRLKRPGGALRALLELLARGTSDRDALCAAALEKDRDGGAGLARLYYALETMECKGFVRYRLDAGGAPLATLEPLAAEFRLEAPAAGERLRLSRFAYLRRIDGELVLECPLGRARVVLHDERAAALVARLAGPRSASELAAASDGLDQATIETFLGLVASAGAAGACDGEGRLAEDESRALRQWEFHDLLFHTRSRLGRHDYVYGGTYPFRGELAPLPAVKPPGRGARIALYKPDIASLARSDPPFARVTEARRSVRSRGERPLSAAQIGEFLFRVARVKEMGPEPTERIPYQSSLRPCAGGGAMHEIELYLTVARGERIEPGLYRYDPLAHELEHVAALGAAQQRLLADACTSAGLAEPPDALITLAARFQRMAWKYRSMAYAVTLKNAGALYQQMYLAATAMGLAPCGLGGGDSDLFAEAAGLDYYEETSVGEFMLSAR